MKTRTKIKEVVVYEGKPPKDGDELARRVAREIGEKPKFLTVDVLGPILQREAQRERERA